MVTIRFIGTSTSRRHGRNREVASEGSPSAGKQAKRDSQTMSPRIRLWRTYKAEALGELAQHDEALSSGATVNAGVV